MKLPFLLSGDWHLERKTITLVQSLVQQLIEVSEVNEIKTLFLLGDLLTSRKAQEEPVLVVLGDIFRDLYEKGIQVYVIPGNHDKVDGNSDSSFLSEFRHHPGVTLIEKPSVFHFDGYSEDFCFVPFYNDELFVEKIREISSLVKSEAYLFTHQSIYGTQNNEKSVVLNSIKPEIFSSFKKVFLGHIHNRSITGKFEYIGSLYQNNFGEDDQKGVTILSTDFSDELIQLDFPRYKTVPLDANNLSSKDLDKKIKEFSSEIGTNRIRFQFSGSSEKIDSLNLDKVKASGIAISSKVEKIDVQDQGFDLENSVEVKELSDEDLRSLFNQFCEKENLSEAQKSLGEQMLIELIES